MFTWQDTPGKFLFTWRGHTGIVHGYLTGIYCLREVHNVWRFENHRKRVPRIVPSSKYVSVSLWDFILGLKCLRIRDTILNFSRKNAKLMKMRSSPPSFVSLWLCKKRFNSWRYGAPPFPSLWIGQQSPHCRRYQKGLLVHFHTDSVPARTKGWRCREGFPDSRPFLSPFISGMLGDKR